MTHFFVFSYSPIFVSLKIRLNSIECRSSSSNPLNSVIVYTWVWTFDFIRSDLIRSLSLTPNMENNRFFNCLFSSLFSAKHGNKTHAYIQSSYRYTKWRQAGLSSVNKWLLFSLYIQKHGKHTLYISLRRLYRKRWLSPSNFLIDH